MMGLNGMSSFLWAVRPFKVKFNFLVLKTFFIIDEGGVFKLFLFLPKIDEGVLHCSQPDKLMR